MAIWDPRVKWAPVPLVGSVPSLAEPGCVPPVLSLVPKQMWSPLGRGSQRASRPEFPDPSLPWLLSLSGPSVQCWKHSQCLACDPVVSSQPCPCEGGDVGPAEGLLGRLGKRRLGEAWALGTRTHRGCVGLAGGQSRSRNSRREEGDRAGGSRAEHALVWVSEQFQGERAF